MAERELLKWHRSARRDLPWRHTRDPWAVLVSEVMLQQTQVARVLERWPAWMERWPTPAALAAAERSDVIPRLAGPRLQPPGGRPAPCGSHYRRPRLAR